VNKLGTIHLQKDGKTYQIDEDASGTQVKALLNLPPDSMLVNAKNEMIADNDKIGKKIADGESVAAKPRFQYW
jgi:hypothetical protein